ncbi:MAG: asparagine synthase (glutamine-hydrolyzing) [Kiritimatiellia bacterium]
MCGIVGFCSPERLIDPALLDRMRDALAHRGPDGAGSRLWNLDGTPAEPGRSGALGLGHRRLSIIDLTESAAQPMPNEDRSLWISFNGEIYNFGDHRASLQAAGHVFQSHCDTETILHLFEQHGIGGALERMNGMFAFALLDPARRRCVLARDRLGKKPLYYVRKADGTLVFASEIKALVAGGFVDRSLLDPVGLDQYWTLGYTCGERTVFEDVRQLPAGCYAEWDDGAFTVRRYWDVRFDPDPAARPFDDLVDEFSALLDDAVRLRLVADVPVGLFLSGGIDSSLVCAVARRIHPELCAYTIAFDGDAHDESGHAAGVAAHLGLRHRILKVDAGLRDSFGPAARQFDTPFGDVSAIPTWHLCRLARKHVTVALTGDAGDELFGGYDDYRTGLSIWGTPAQRALFRSPETLRAKISGLRNRLRGPARGFVMWARQFGQNHKRSFYSARLMDAGLLPRSLADRLEWGRTCPSTDALAIMQDIDLHTYLVDDILVKVDRMSMAASLECRTPLLDHRIVEFAARLPFSAKFDGRGRGKRLLRALLARSVPEALWDRPKQGFTPPWQDWLDHEAREDLRARWTGVMPRAWFLPSGGEALLARREGSFPLLTWNVFSAVEFFDSLRGGV